MSQVITAYYDSRAEAERVQQELTGLGIRDQDHGGNRHRVYHSDSASYRPGSYSDDTDRGFWDRLTDDDDHRLLPDRDRHAYEEGVHRGGAVLTVTADDQMCERACAVIRQSGAEDIETQAAKWEHSGWARPQAHGSDRRYRFDEARSGEAGAEAGRYRVYRYEG